MTTTSSFGRTKETLHHNPDAGTLAGTVYPPWAVPAFFAPVAALYVDRKGSYIDLAGVDPWDEARDARLYAGPHPVVAHPPCQRWGKLWAGQPLFIKRTGIRKIKGDDDGCFAAALAAVRQWGGVLEHPWQSHAWPHFGIPVPPRSGGWIATGDGGWTCCVEQRPYGHYARKPTMLLVYGVDRGDLPELVWGKGERQLDPEVVARMGLKRAIRLGEVGGKGGGTDSAPRIGTPAPFRDLLLSIARSARPIPAFIPDEAELIRDLPSYPIQHSAARLANRDDRSAPLITSIHELRVSPQEHPDHA